jgi:hypothetical protein
MSWSQTIPGKDAGSPDGSQPRDIAFERPYSIAEIIQLWGLSEKTVRRLFAEEPDVITWGHEEKRFGCAYRTLRIPKSVLRRVHRRIRKAG